jgi:hypothetical protein
MEKGNGFIMNDSPSKKTSPLPKINFSSFILSLYSTGLVQLGKVEDPSSGAKSVNLELAQHTIDMIAMLEEKTRGNLSDEEKNLLKALLSELRLAFVEAKA